MAQADEGIVPTATARVALATREVGSLRVALDNSDITPRLTGGGRLREAVVRGRLVEPGGALAEHSLAPCPRGDERMIARRVVVARRSGSLMRALFHPRRPHSASGVVRLRLTVASGVGQMRVWVNGRSACVRHLGRLWPTVSLTRGASHDLRPGTNRIRVVLHHFGRARYDVETFTVKLRRSRPLAAGIAEYRGGPAGAPCGSAGAAPGRTRPGRRLRNAWRGGWPARARADSTFTPYGKRRNWRSEPGKPPTRRSSSERTVAADRRLDLHRVVIEFRRAEGSMSLVAEGQEQPQPFSGWFELLALLEAARSPAGQTPKPTQEESP